MSPQTSKQLEAIESLSPKNDNPDLIDPKEYHRMAAENEYLKQSVKTMKTSRDFYKNLLSRIKDVTLLISLDGKIEFISPVVRDFAGYDPEEVKGTHIENYFANPEEYQYTSKIIEALLISKRPLRPIEFLLKTKNKTPFYVEALGYLAFNNNKPVSMEIVLRNIDKRKNAEQQLKAIDEKFRDFFNQLPDYAYIHDLDGNFLDVNNAFKEVIDYYGNEVSQVHLKHLVPARHHNQTQEYLQRLQNKESLKGITKIVFPNGREQYLAYRSNPVTLPNGVTLARGFAQDVTERIEMKRRLKERENYYQSVFENSGTAIFILEEDFTISSINLKGANLLGRTREEIENKVNLFSCLSLENKKFHLKEGTFRKDMLEKSIVEFEATLVDCHNRKHFMLINTQYIPGTRKMIASAVEISDRKKMEEILKKSRTDLEKRVQQRTQELLNANILLKNQMQERVEMETKLRLSEIKYRRLFENTGMATIVIDKDGTITKVNKRFINGLGYKRDTIEGKANWQDFIPTQDLDKLRSLWKEVKNIPLPKTIDVEFNGIKKGGDIAQYSGRVVAFPGTDQIIISFMDVTYLKQTEAALIASENRLHTLMNNLPGMAYKCEDSDNKAFLFISQGCKTITGFDAPYLIDAKAINYADLIHPEDRQRVLMQIKKAIHSKTSFQTKYRIRTAYENEKWVLQTGQGIFSESGELVSIEGIIIDATDHVKEEQALVNENIRLRSTIKGSYRFGNIIGKSQSMQNVYELILKASNRENHVIVYGESGTGKELVAKAIHDLSDRRDNRFTAVNCGAIPENLIESEFFGYKKGAFTGAVQDKKGFFAEADGGTIFLDEIGEISVNMQVKLLRVIEDGGYTPIGASQPINTNVRIIAATNRNLWELTRKGKMREDFYYRIHVLPIHLPPLRERIEDLPLLIEHFLKSYGNANLHDLPPEIFKTFRSYHWPGNIRELQNVLFRYVTLGNIEFMEKSVNSGQPRPMGGQPELFKHDTRGLRSILADMEKQVILLRLEENNWNKSKTALDLEIDRKTLFKKIKEYSLSN